MISVTGVPVILVGKAIKECHDLLAHAVATSEGRFNMLDVVHDLNEGRKQMFLAYDDAIPVACVITAVTVYPRRKVLSILFVAGDEGLLPEWIGQMIEVLEYWALDSGCDGIQATGRRGWKKILAEYGFDETFVTYEKRLVDG